MLAQRAIQIGVSDEVQVVVTGDHPASEEHEGWTIAPSIMT